MSRFSFPPDFFPPDTRSTPKKRLFPRLTPVDRGYKHSLRHFASPFSKLPALPQSKVKTKQLRYFPGERLPSLCFPGVAPLSLGTAEMEVTFRVQ